MTTAVLEVPRLEAFAPRPVPLQKTDGDNWNVVLLDDDDHTYDYVIEMLHNIFGHPVFHCFAMAKEVDTAGRVVVFTGSKADAEWGRDAILSYGRDPRLPRSRGPMGAVIEQA